MTKCLGQGSASRLYLACLGILLVLTPTAGLSTTPPPASEICEDFAAIIDASAAAYEPIRGELISRHEDPVGDTRVLWQCSFLLPGASDCEIEWFGQTSFYHAYWRRGEVETHAKLFAALGELTRSCGMEERKTTTSGRSVWLVIAAEPDLDVVLAYNEDRVRLSFARVGIPNP